MSNLIKIANGMAARVLEGEVMKDELRSIVTHGSKKEKAGLLSGIMSALTHPASTHAATAAAAGTAMFHAGKHVANKSAKKQLKMLIPAIAGGGILAGAAGAHALKNHKEKK